MIKLNHDLTLDLYYNEEKTIDTKEYDKNSRYITVRLTYKGKEYAIGNSIKAKIKWLKPDKKAVFNDCIINSNNTITINLTEQMLLVSGVAKATLSLYDITLNQVVSTTSFNAIIESSAFDNSVVTSSNEFDTLNKMILDEDKRIEAVKNLDKLVTDNEKIRQANEETRKINETKRINAENIRKQNETTRTNAESERVKNENTRIVNEKTRQTQETKRQNDTATAITNANNAAKNANDKANDLQNKLDNHHFVLTNELKNSVSSTSTTHAPTANAVKITYDKAVSVENTINSNKNNWNDKYTKNEIDNKFSTLESNIDWKESVNSYADIVKTYPNPEDGWTVNVKDTDYTYRYSGSTWVAISANAIPKATQSVDGLLTKEDKTSYDDANSKKHTHSNKSILDGITSALVNTWNKVTDKLDKTGDASNTTNTITTATARTNLTTGEKLSVSLGKIAKFFADLKTVAFTGNYNDLSNKPLIGNGTITIKQAGVNKGSFTLNQDGNTTIELTDDLKTSAVTGIKGNAESTYRTGNVNLTPANIGALATTGGVITGDVIPHTNEYIDLGHEDKKWDNVWTHTLEADYVNAKEGIQGNLTGNADTASGIKPIDITGKTIDVNTLTLSTGTINNALYVERTDGGASNIKNIPVSGKPFKLYVELVRWVSTTDYITKQTFVSSGSSGSGTASTYERWCAANGTWTSWLPNTRFTTNPTNGQVLIADGVNGGIKTSGYTIASSVPANAKFTDTNTTYPIYNKTINGSYTTAFRTQTKGNATHGDFISTIRNDTANVAGSPQYSSGIAFGRNDTHGYLNINYNSEQAYIGGGNGDKLNWYKAISLDGHTHNFLLDSNDSRHINFAYSKANVSYDVDNLYLACWVGGTTPELRAMNKSTFAKSTHTHSYNDLSNKPTIPSVGNGTVTITQNGTKKGSFTMNQSGNATIALSDNNDRTSVTTKSTNGNNIKGTYKCLTLSDGSTKILYGRTNATTVNLTEPYGYAYWKDIYIDLPSYFNTITYVGITPFLPNTGLLNVQHIGSNPQTNILALRVFGAKNEAITCFFTICIMGY